MTKRTFGKKLIMRAPSINLDVDSSVDVKILQKRAEVQTKYKAIPMVTLELLAPFTSKSVKKGVKDTEFKEGDVVAMFIKAGLVPLMDLPEGTECRITCTGTVDTGKGNPAYTYEVDLAE